MSGESTQPPSTFPISHIRLLPSRHKHIISRSTQYNHDVGTALHTALERRNFHIPRSYALVGGETFPGTQPMSAMDHQLLEKLQRRDIDPEKPVLWPR